MTYSASRSDVKNIVDWLRGDDESRWANQISSLSAAISTFKDIAHPPKQPVAAGRPSTEADLPTEGPGINAAMPHLLNMLNAMHDHSRESALAEGTEALEFLPDG